MKRVLLIMLGVTIITNVYAENFTMYVKPDTKSNKLGQVDNQNPQYQTIFLKDDWVEIVNREDGKVGWVKQNSIEKNSLVIQKGPIEQGMIFFQKKQKLINTHFDQMLLKIDQNVDQLQTKLDPSIGENLI